MHLDGMWYFDVAEFQSNAVPHLRVMSNGLFDTTATTVKFEGPLVGLSEAHRSSGCLATLNNVGSIVELLGAWVDCARQPNCGITPVS